MGKKRACLNSKRIEFDDVAMLSLTGHLNALVWTYLVAILSLPVRSVPKGTTD